MSALGIRSAASADRDVGSPLVSCLVRLRHVAPGPTLMIADTGRSRPKPHGAPVVARLSSKLLHRLPACHGGQSRSQLLQIRPRQACTPTAIVLPTAYSQSQSTSQFWQTSNPTVAHGVFGTHETRPLAHPTFLPEINRTGIVRRAARIHQLVDPNARLRLRPVRAKRIHPAPGVDPRTHAQPEGDDSR